jgi:diacylglycerol kinase family enzyme
MSNPVVKRGATMLANAMENGEHKRFSMTTQTHGEPPTSIVVAATGIDARILIKVLNRYGWKIRV